MTAELYHQRLVALAQNLPPAEPLSHPHGQHTLHNPFCGDTVTLQWRCHHGRITAIGHEARGCILIQATIAIIRCHGVGRTIAELAHQGNILRQFLSSHKLDRDQPPYPPGLWDDLHILEPVQHWPSRHSCALLPFQTFAHAPGNTPR